MNNKNLSKSISDKSKKYFDKKNKKSSIFLKSVYTPNPKYSLYINNSSYSTFFQEQIEGKKNEEMPLINKNIKSSSISNLSNSHSQLFLYSSKKNEKDEKKEVPLRKKIMSSVDSIYQRNNSIDKK